jgi:hypothetical protein
VAAALGTNIGRLVDAVGTGIGRAIDMCWILAAAASTLDSTLAVRSGIMDAANAVGTSGTRRVRSGMICIFSNYIRRIKFLSI